MGVLIAQATELARSLLDTPTLADRWHHVGGVARRAKELASTVDEVDRDLLVAAAWLHDIGYAPALLKTGMHAIDGAAHLKQEGYGLRLVGLVAFHTGATYEAEERGLTAELAGFQRIDDALEDALTTADLETDPTGFPIEAHQRIKEILCRYPAGSAVQQAVVRAQTELLAQVQRCRSRLRSGPAASLAKEPLH